MEGELYRRPARDSGALLKLLGKKKRRGRAVLLPGCP